MKDTNRIINLPNFLTSLEYELRLYNLCLEEWDDKANYEDHIECVKDFRVVRHEGWIILEISEYSVASENFVPHFPLDSLVKIFKTIFESFYVAVEYKIYLDFYADFKPLTLALKFNEKES